MPDTQQSADTLAAISRWIDKDNAHRDPEAITWGRLSKVSEECGEVIAAWIGVTGQNPRKGYTHNSADVVKELLDVALTALCAVEHMDGNVGTSMDRLVEHIAYIAERAGVTA